MYNVFVYGTLMKGKRNYRLLSDQKFVGTGILMNYKKYDVTPSYPGVVSKDGDRVYGEVYSVDHDALVKLDILEVEGYLYIRKLEKILVGDTECEAFVYVWNQEISEYEKSK